LEAWEIYLDQRRQEATVLEVIEARKRQLQIGKVLLSKGLEGLLALKPTIARKNAAGEMEHILCIKPSDLVKLVEVGVRFVKDALGEVDEDKPTKFELICGLRKSAARDGILRAAGSRATAGDRGGVRVLIGVISGALGAVPGQNSPARPKSSVCGQANGTISCAALSSTWQVRFAGVIGQAGECQTEQGPLSASSGQSGSLSCGPSLGSNLGDCKRHMS